MTRDFIDFVIGIGFPLIAGTVVLVSAWLGVRLLYALSKNPRVQSGVRQQLPTVGLIVWVCLMMEFFWEALNFTVLFLAFLAVWLLSQRLWRKLDGMSFHTLRLPFRFVKIHNMGLVAAVILTSVSCSSETPGAATPISIGDVPSAPASEAPYNEAPILGTYECSVIEPDPEIFTYDPDYPSSDLAYSTSFLDDPEDIYDDNSNAIEHLQNAVNDYERDDPRYAIAAKNLECVLLEQASREQAFQRNYGSGSTFGCESYLEAARNVIEASPDASQLGEALDGAALTYEFWASGCARIPKVAIRTIPWTDSSFTYADPLDLLEQHIVYFEYFITAQVGECKSVELMVGGALPADPGLGNCDLIDNQNVTDMKPYYLPEEGVYCWDVAVYGQTTSSSGQGPIYIPDNRRTLESSPPTYEVVEEGSKAKLQDKDLAFILYRELDTLSEQETVEILADYAKSEIELSDYGDLKEAKEIRMTTPSEKRLLLVRIKNGRGDELIFHEEVSVSDDDIFVIRSNFVEKTITLGKQVCNRSGELIDSEPLTSSPVFPTPAPETLVDAPTSSPTLSCYDTVQGNLAWDYAGSTTWDPTNVTRLCAGNEYSVEPAQCFGQVMHDGIDWGGGTRWQWEDAIDLCEGTGNAWATIDCFQNRIQQGWLQQEAIAYCKR